MSGLVRALPNVELHVHIEGTLEKAEEIKQLSIVASP